MLKKKVLIISLIFLLLIFIGLIVLTFINFGAFKEPAKKVAISAYSHIKDSSSNNDSLDNDSSTNDSDNSSSADGNVSINLKTSNSWSVDTQKNVQLDATISNKTANDVSDWTVELNLPEGTHIKQVWNASYTKDGNKFTFSPVTHNKKIAVGNDVTFGIIATSTNDIEITNAKVKVK